MAPLRLLSHTEAETLLDCSLKHDLAYVGQSLNGHTAQSRYSHYYLRRGRAWGIAIQTWHTTGDLDAARTLMLRALEDDADQLRAAGMYLAEEHAELYDLLTACLDHCAASMPRLDLAEPEKRLITKIPGVRGWRFEARLDGVATVDGELFPYEAKIRSQLTSVEQVTLARQPRWYAAAWRRATGKTPAGFIVDERLAKAPEPDAPVRFNKDGSVSKVQACTPAAYLAACREHATPVNPDTLDKAEKRHDPRTYHARHVIRFTTRELDEADQQQASSAHLIRLHERGVLTPIRNPSRSRCPSCAYREICPEPTRENAEVFFDLRPPKRHRQEATT